MTDENKKITGDYYRNIIAVLEMNIMRMTEDREKYAGWKRFITGIDRNIRNRRKQLKYYRNILDRYIRQGWAI